MKPWKAWTSSLAFLVLVGTSFSIRPPLAWGADNKEQARQHYKKASQLYDVGRWDDALAEYEQAYTLREDPSLLFNMAQTCRRKGDLKRALDLYKNYLVKDPESPMRPEVESRIKALKAQIEQGEKPTAETGALMPPAVAPVPAGGAQAVEPPAPAAPSPPASTPPAPTSSIPKPPVIEAPPAAAVAPQPPAIVPTPGTSPATVPMAPGPANPPSPAPIVYPPAQAAPGTFPPTAPDHYQVPPAPSVPPAPLAPAPGSAFAPPMMVAQPATAPSPAKAEGSSGWPLIITGTVVTAGGLVCLGLGVYNAVQTKLLSDKVTSGKTFSPHNDEQGKRAYKLQWIEGGIGIGAVVVGATLYTIGSIQHSSHESKVSLVPLVQPDSAMLAATGGF